jgi:hypothetical protein
MCLELVCVHQAKLVDANKFSVADFILGQASFR